MGADVRVVCSNLWLAQQAALGIKSPLYFYNSNQR